ncbi:hypothetical protein TREAZ_3302 [Leadbettera azotonutricia ZAS-9]|uniref:Uncharacterized protein n=1 Tax=Leadbettera azotonutricia (strain ATCC BAA-888 / DSM 13862 / ZAS-9) TaxID=545695 RepID=F5Y920_LEAAZ|nr:hypothetical protein TREAZ_3302 [Leadbettera azotonutricia ZAS-9]
MRSMPAGKDALLSPANTGGGKTLAKRMFCGKLKGIGGSP